MLKTTGQPIQLPQPWSYLPRWINGIMKMHSSWFPVPPQPLQQGILDELEGALQSGKSIRNILGWLNSIVGKANNGTLILGMADHIADVRKGRELQAERERTMVTTTGHSKDSSASIAADTRPANPEVVQAGRNRLKTLQIEMKNKQLGVSK
ncbi:MAG: hypothetical protein IPH35_24035 [Rhodoferax sp.]|nr:hypothetical protein [Rhodoferax sp.]